MTILKRLRSNPPRGDAAGPDSAEAGSADDHRLPFTGYDKLDDKQVGARLSGLSQVELAAVDTYERSHDERPVVLDKLRYLRESEPLPGYDALSADEIGSALAGADTLTVKAVRDYERKFGHRKQVLDETARVLPTSPASAGEVDAREAQAARIRDGFAGRAKTAAGLSDDASDRQEGRDGSGPDG